MAFVVPPRVLETGTGSGTGDVTLLGAVGSGEYDAFNEHLSVNDSTIYVIVDGSQFEIGYGTYSSATPNNGTLTRDTVIRSSSGTSKISLSGSNFNIFHDTPNETVLVVGPDGAVTNVTAVAGAVIPKDIATLKALEEPADNTVVWLGYGATEGDGLGGKFRWDDGSTATADDVNVIQLDAIGAGPGRWIRERDFVWPAEVASDSNPVDTIARRSDTHNLVSNRSDTGYKTIPEVQTVARAASYATLAAVKAVASTNWKQGDIVELRGWLADGDLDFPLLLNWEASSTNTDSLDVAFIRPDDISGANPGRFQIETPARAIKFADSDATPSVKDGVLFTGPDTAPAAITAFDDFRDGKTIIIQPGAVALTINYVADEIETPDREPFVLETRANGGLPIVLYKENGVVNFSGGGGAGGRNPYGSNYLRGVYDARDITGVTGDFLPANFGADNFTDDTSAIQTGILNLTSGQKIVFTPGENGEQFAITSIDLSGIQPYVDLEWIAGAWWRQTAKTSQNYFLRLGGPNGDAQRINFWNPHIVAADNTDPASTAAQQYPRTWLFSGNHPADDRYTGTRYYAQEINVFGGHTRYGRLAVQFGENDGSLAGYRAPISEIIFHGHTIYDYNRGIFMNQSEGYVEFANCKIVTQANPTGNATWLAGAFTAERDDAYVVRSLVGGVAINGGAVQNSINAVWDFDGQGIAVKDAFVEVGGQSRYRRGNVVRYKGTVDETATPNETVEHLDPDPMLIDLGINGFIGDDRRKWMYVDPDMRGLVQIKGGRLEKNVAGAGSGTVTNVDDVFLHNASENVSCLVDLEILDQRWDEFSNGIVSRGPVIVRRLDIVDDQSDQETGVTAATDALQVIKRAHDLEAKENLIPYYRIDVDGRWMSTTHDTSLKGGWAAVNGVSFSRNTAETPPHMDYSMRFQVSSGFSGEAFLVGPAQANRIPIDGKRQYVLDFWIKNALGTSDVFDIEMEYYDASNVSLGTEFVFRGFDGTSGLNSPAMDGAWNRVVCHITPPTDAAAYRFRFSGPGSQTNGLDIYLSDVKLLCADGVQSMPDNRIAFLSRHATANATDVTGNNTTHTVAFAAPLMSTGEFFDGTDFTAPIQGIYQFSTNVRLAQIPLASGTQRNAFIQISTTQGTYDRYFDLDALTYDATGDDIVTLSLTTYAEMAAGDTAKVQVRVNGVGADTVDIDGGIETNFGGEFIAPAN